MWRCFVPQTFVDGAVVRFFTFPKVEKHTSIKHISRLPGTQECMDAMPGLRCFLSQLCSGCADGFQSIPRPSRVACQARGELNDPSDALVWDVVQRRQ